MAQGVVTSVKDPAETMERVVVPLRAAAEAAGRPRPSVLATRWSLHASNDDEAWEALYSWRGLRAPGRLEAVDPADLRERADKLPREEVLERYSLVATAEQIIDVYRPLVDDLGADVVTFQMASLDQPRLIRLLGEEVLPALRS
jgi:coenzyme F420-dependent glucose-6-phosphate dehydrogenase